MEPQHYLYKVSPPRADMVFQPSKFWRSEDWESSSTRARAGYIEDVVLYAGDFDEVSIHLLPRIRTLRVRTADADAARLNRLGLRCRPDVSAHIFAARARRNEIEAFQPTIFKFDRRGFTNVRRGEYVSWQAQTAISAETIPISAALQRWNVEVCYVEELSPVISRLSDAGIYFEEQT